MLMCGRCVSPARTHLPRDRSDAVVERGQGRVARDLHEVLEDQSGRVTLCGDAPEQRER